MDHTPPRPTREDRLAAKLRENLRRRKSQARELDQSAAAPDDNPAILPIPGLPKGNPSS
ncbi:hypothetical protein [Novosphingobium sp.]|uniref:hypothetical protein n=1 Tax=Novosphingobium sp. TaxID=1874826 RepID=UPI002736DAD1|nr:hypothetical protein [Novosphingobium sp.]MDP3906176.1 hypothetical protein [Novosphingobium sp.]